MMEGIYLGKVTKGFISKNNAILTFDGYQQDITKPNDSIEYDNTTYCLVPSNDIIINNDELLKLRDEVKELKIQIEMLEAANTDRAKNLLAMTKNRDYFEEKADSVEKKYEELVAEHTKLQAELTKIKTARTLREAYISGVEKGCESLIEERDRWKSRWNSVVTDIGELLKANGITFVLKEIHGDGNWDVVIDIPELNIVKAENDKLRGMITTNFRDLLKESGINFELTQPNGPESLTLEFDIPELAEVKAKVADLEKKLEAAKSNETFWRDRKEEEEDYHHYWLHTFDRAVKQAAEKGIHIGVCGSDEDCNAGVVVVDNMKAEELKRQIKRLEDDNAAKGDHWKHEYNKKWQAMLNALKAKGVEVIYMGEQNDKPIVDVKIPEIDILKKELEALKSRTLDNVEIRLSCGDIVWTYCDGFVHVSSGISGMISADEISTGTVPKCSSCAHYASGSRSADIWCHKPVSKEGPGTIRRLSTEEAEGLACSDFKAQKE